MLREEGFAYFESWYEELFEDGVDPHSTTQTDSLAWQVNEFALCVGVPGVTYRTFMHTTNYLVPLQTWDLLRIVFQGFIGLWEHFLSRYPGYLITPFCINGSAIESYFIQLK